MQFNTLAKQADLREDPLRRVWEKRAAGTFRNPQFRPPLRIPPQIKRRAFEPDINDWRPQFAEKEIRETNLRRIWKWELMLEKRE